MDQGRPAIRAADPLIDTIEAGGDALRPSGFIGRKGSLDGVAGSSSDSRAGKGVASLRSEIRSIFFQVRDLVALVASALVDRRQHDREPAALQHRLGLRLPARPRRLRHLPDSLIAYSSDSTYGRALLVGLLNTLLVAVVGIVTATILGFLVGVGRLSQNWLIRKIATIYVEVFRNIPPLLVIFFWYLGVLAVLPAPRDSIDLPFGSFLNSRGFYPAALRSGVTAPG